MLLLIKKLSTSKTKRIWFTYAFVRITRGSRLLLSKYFTTLQLKSTIGPLETKTAYVCTKSFGFTSDVKRCCLEYVVHCAYSDWRNLLLVLVDMPTQTTLPFNTDCSWLTLDFWNFKNFSVFWLGTLFILGCDCFCNK